MNSDYKRHAYARTILFDLAHYLKDRYIAAEAPPKDVLLCEEVLYAEREVPQEALHSMMIRLRRLEEQERLDMAEYEMLRRQPTPPAGEGHEPRAPQKKRSKGDS